MIVILSALKLTTKEASVTDVAEIVQRDEQKRGLQSPHASFAEFMGVLDVNEGTSLTSSQAFEITTEKKVCSTPKPPLLYLWEYWMMESLCFPPRLSIKLLHEDVNNLMCLENVPQLVPTHQS